MSTPTSPSNGFKLLGHDPAFWVATFQSIILVALAFGVQADLGVVLNTIAVAVGGLLTALTVRETLLAALLALVQAVAGLVVYLGYDLSPEQIATILGALSVILGGYLRTQTVSLSTPITRESEGATQQITATVVTGDRMYDYQAATSTPVHVNATVTSGPPED